MGESGSARSTPAKRGRAAGWGIVAGGAVALVLGMAEPAFADGSLPNAPGAPYVSGVAAKGPAKLGHSAAAKKVKAAGISLHSSGGCTDRNKKTCTSLSQVNKASIDGVIAFKKASKCKVTITGGTEKGHASGTYSHWNGYKLDISVTSCVTKYIKKNFKSIGKRRDGYPQWKAPSTNLYCNEGNHWDIVFYRGKA